MSLHLPNYLHNQTHLDRATSHARDPKSVLYRKWKTERLQELQKMACSNLSSPFPAYKCRNLSKKQFLSYTSRYIPLPSSSRLFSSPARIIVSSASAAMERAETTEAAAMNLLFVEMGVGYDQHGQVLFPSFPSFFLAILQKTKFSKKTSSLMLSLSLTGKILRSQQCGHARMRFLPTRFRLSEEVCV